MFFLPPNNVFINHSNDITKFAYLIRTGSEGQRISDSYRIARVSIDMNPESLKLPIKERDREIDEAHELNQ